MATQTLEIIGPASNIKCTDGNGGSAGALTGGGGTSGGSGGVDATAGAGGSTVADPVLATATALIEEGRQTFRFDTFGDEKFWGDTLKLHTAIAGEANGGVGAGLTPTAALGLGLKVDSDALPAEIIDALKANQVDLEDPKTTLTLLKANAVLGVTGIFEGETLKSMGIQCAFCHSIDDSLAPGIGKRLDGWPNRDLDVGKIVSLGPDLSAVTTLLGVDLATLKTVLAGCHGKELCEGTAKCATCHVPPLFTEAGWNMHTAAEIVIDDFQAQRSPDQRYRTTPLKGLFTRQNGGFYHDGRFPTLGDVVNHYDGLGDLGLTATDKTDLVEYLKSL